MRVGLVIVSHSDTLARGVVEVAAQMAPDVRVVAAGGLPDRSVGTDFERASAALSGADSGSGAVVLYDLGSARMTAELAVEALAEPGLAIVADAPLVEGAVAAAVAAQGGNDRDAVARAAQAAGAPAEDTASPDAPPERQGEAIDEEIVLNNEVGLHARPAALMARSLTGLEADVTVTSGQNEADARSVLAIMGLGVRKGDRVGLRATGPDARRAVDTVVDLAARNFDE